MEAVIKDFEANGRITENKGYGKDITNAELLELEVDVLAPCALENQITSENADRVKAKVVAEGAGATSLAGLMSSKIDIKGKTVCCVISGGNIDVNNIEKIVNKAQILQARRVRFVVYLSDTVGQINKLTKILMNNYANILYLNQTRYNIDLNITEQELSVVIECKNREHSEHILNELEKEGFKIKRK